MGEVQGDIPGGDPSPRQPTGRRPFTRVEDETLRALVAQHGMTRWDLVAGQMPLRSSKQCRDRYVNYLADNLCDAEWTAVEDAVIFQKVREIGPKWAAIARFLHGRSENAVKNRWHKHLSKRFNPYPHFFPFLRPALPPATPERRPAVGFTQAAQGTISPPA
jgi:hypothetical protein